MMVYHVCCRNHCRIQPCWLLCRHNSSNPALRSSQSHYKEPESRWAEKNRQGKHKAERQPWFNKTWHHGINVIKTSRLCYWRVLRAAVLLPSPYLSAVSAMWSFSAWQQREASSQHRQTPPGLPLRVGWAVTLSACTWHLSLLFLFWEEEKQLSSATECEGGRWGVNSVVIVLLICLAWKWWTHDRTTRNKHGGGGVGILNSF